MISVKFSGRLGNNLFQIAAAYAQAKRCEQEFFIPPWKYAQYYPHIPVKEHKFTSFHNEPAFHYNPIKCSGDMELRGYYQSSKYFEDCEEDIRELFNPDEETQRYVEERMGDVVGIHIRRSDYLKYPEHHVNLGLDYYEKALDIFKGPRFIFSDDIPWCKDNIKADYYSDGNEIQDLYLLSSCPRIVMANSSFSWFSAFLSDCQDVIAPAQWFGPRLNHKTHDLYLKKWQLL